MRSMLLKIFEYSWKTCFLITTGKYAALNKISQFFTSNTKE